MEVADQWRREWAGTAEYGKVTEGGVTRRIARAMEVLHASAPGAKVRVMRAAYHSSAGPGAPASSYMLHSSRRVISSGFNFLESPTSIKPLELCSMPLEMSPEPSGDTHNYKVTEPDDIEISEPSKWRGSTGTGSVRMPSEESSSTDNASIIDLTGNKHLLRKYSYDSESSDVQWTKRGSARASPLLDAPVTLSTLKYKSFLNGSTEWNNRRKSYSFEDTSPLNESILHSNDTLAMESSTDSGICKSSEIVNDHINETSHIKQTDREERRSLSKDESFRDWLYKNRQNSYNRNNLKTPSENEVFMENTTENNIRLQSTGKVSITLPITIETDDDYQYKKTLSSAESDRKVKRVEFCKTEVHFTAESGKVNIIATDEKPPPSNDFRKRRSAFVPMKEMLDKHITLFGEKGKDIYCDNPTSDLLNTSNGEFGETDENTAATKSILKNKIPKPKPYLLGENMVLGLTNDNSNDEHSNTDTAALTAVSLINRQLQSGKLSTPPLSRKIDQKPKDNTLRTIDEGPSKKEELYAVNTKRQMHKIDSNLEFSQNNRFKDMKKSPTEGKLKTRQLRDSDLTYFGVDRGSKQITTEINNIEDKFTLSRDSSVEELRSVRLIQQVSNSLCNSEAESEDSHEYQNVPINYKYTPIPTPRRSTMRSKYDDKQNAVYEIQMLNPILEQDHPVVKDADIPTSRRSKLRKFEEKISTSRSISEPPKNNRYNSMPKSPHRNDHPLRGSKNHAIKEHERVNRISPNKIKVRASKPISGDEPPIYENIDIEAEKSNSISKSTGSYANKTDRVENRRSRNRQDTSRNENKSDEKKSHRSRSSNDSNKVKTLSRSSQDDTKIHVQKLKSIKTPNSDLVGFTPIPKVTNNVPRENETKLSPSKAVSKSDKNYTAAEKTSDVKNHSTRHTITSATKVSKGACKSNNKPPDISSLKRTDDNDRKKNPERPLNHKNNPKKGSVNLDTNTSTSDTNLIKLKSSDRKSTHMDSINGHIPKRSEYVINYDDKNGTVSSIRKLKNPISPKKKRNIKEIVKESPKENTVRNKAFDKIVLRK